MIHPTALVSPKAQVAHGVSVGPFTVVHDDVIVGEGSVIEGHCEIGHPTPLAKDLPLVIGKNSLIRSHSIFYQGSSFGDGLVTGHRVTVREKTTAGVAFQIGTSSEIQGDCCVGDHVRFQSNIFVGKNTTIGNFVWVLPYAVLTNDPTPPSNVMQGCVLKDYACICAAAVVLPGVVIGEHALVAAHACVTKNVSARTLVAGVPAKEICPTSDIKRRDGSGQSAYPWTKHFNRGYPDAVIQQWLAEHGNHNP